MASALLAAALVAGRTPIWAPQPGSQTAFITCPISECIYEGTRGPGKSDALLFDFARDVGRGYGDAWRGIIFRESYPQLSDLVKRSKKWFHQIYPDARFIKSGPDGYTWVWPDGEELSFRYMESADDVVQYQGHEFPWIGWEELCNFADLDAYHAMRACWRSSVQGIPRRLRATANPFGIGHHVIKAYIVDPAPAGVPIANGEGLLRVRIHGHWSENKILLAADPDYVKNLASDTNINRRKAWLNGDWDIVAGGFFDDVWDRSKHVIRPFHIPKSWRVDRSFDWGSSRPFSVGWWAESDGTLATMADGTQRSFPRGTLFRIAEWYGMEPGKPNVGTKMLAVDIARGVLERDNALGAQGASHPQDGPADPSIYSVENGVSIADDMEKVGVTWTRGDNSPGSRKNGWERMRKYFAAALESRPEEPGLYVFDTCTDFIRTVPILPRHKIKLDDIDSTSEDHIADEARMRVLALPPAVWTSTSWSYG